MSVSTIFSFFLFYFTVFLLICSPRDTFHNLATMFNPISLQAAFDCLISLQYTVNKIFAKLQTPFQNEEKNDQKEFI